MKRQFKKSLSKLAFVFIAIAPLITFQAGNFIAVFYRCRVSRRMAHRGGVVARHDGIGENSGHELARHSADGRVRPYRAAVLVVG